MIQNLGDFEQGGKELEGRSHRAYLIWKKMEYCIDVREDLRVPNPRNHYTVPKPNRETYLSILTLHATVNGRDRGRGAPERALEIVQRMEERYDAGHWDARPSVMIWNQVIASWASSTHSEKGYEAAKVLRTYMGDIADVSSYGNVFKACATTEGNVRAKELAGKIALRIWEELKGSDLLMMKDGDENANALVFDRGSYMFVFAMKAVQLVEDEKLRDQAVKSQFYTACKLGLANTHVLQTFQSVASPELMTAILGKYGTKKVKGGEKRTGHIFQNIPKRWKRNCKTNSFGW